MFRRSPRTPAQAIAEFALVLPLLVLLLVGVVELGFFIYAQVQVTNAAREGARAATLYLSERFHYTSCETNCPPGYGDGAGNAGCWTLTQWVDNALAQRPRAASGCPMNSHSTTVHAFGRLNPAPCASPTSGKNCWFLAGVRSNGVPISGLPEAGAPIEVEVLYRYQMPFAGAIVRAKDGTIAIRKSVIMRGQIN
jgi:hypothetical protein